MTQLLVSVRNAVEAIAAIEGLADIVDVKEPAHGSLGCATPEIIAEVAAAVRSHCDAAPHCGLAPPEILPRPLSLALGELSEWREGDRSLLRDAIATAKPQFLKLGLAGAGNLQNADSWIGEWQGVRDAISGPHVWVAVAYADHENANSPTAESVLHAAIETNCGILLIDTYAKNGTSLLDHLTLNQLLAIRRATSQRGLKLALAGRVTLSNLNLLLSIQADIIAVRGAVCENGNRVSSIRKERVSEFRAAVHAG